MRKKIFYLFLMTVCFLMASIKTTMASSQCTYDPDFYVKDNVLNSWHGSNTGKLYLSGRAFDKDNPTARTYLQISLSQLISPDDIYTVKEIYYITTYCGERTSDICGSDGSFQIELTGNDKFESGIFEYYLTELPNSYYHFNLRASLKRSHTNSWWVAACEEDFNDPIWFSQKPVSKMTIKASDGQAANNKTLTGYIGKTYNYKISVSPAGASDWVTWKSSKPSVVTITTTGEATCKATGPAKITATAADGSGVKASFTQNCYPKASGIIIRNDNNVTINGKTFSTNKAEYQLKVSAQPSGALQNFGYVSSDTSVALVDIYGKIMFRKLGTATITVNARDGSGQKASFTITYVPIKTTKLNIYSPEGKVINGKSVTTKTRIYKMSGAAKPAEALQIFSWTSGNTNIATVNVYGVVGFKKPGTVKVLVGTRDGSGHKTTVTITYAP